MASKDDSFIISVLAGLVTFSVSIDMTSVHVRWGSSVHAICATHWAAELGRMLSVPNVSKTLEENFNITIIMWSDIKKFSFTNISTYFMSIFCNHIFLHMCLHIIRKLHPSLLMLCLYRSVLRIQCILKLQSCLHASNRTVSTMFQDIRQLLQ